MEKDELFEYIKHFDTVFGTNIINTIDKNKLIVFLKIHEKIGEELSTPTEEYLRLQKEKNKLLENLIGTFNEEQRKNLNNFLDLDTKTKAIYNKQMMIFEFILANILL